MKIDFTEDELYCISRCILNEVNTMGRIHDPRIEELVELDEKLSSALYIEPRAHAVFVKAISLEDEWMDRSEVIWNKFPDEKPSGKVREMLVSVIDKKGEPDFVFCSEWQGDEDPRFAGVPNEYVTAWAEMPEPYERIYSEDS